MESTESRFGVRNRRWTLMNQESCPNLNSIITAAKLESAFNNTLARKGTAIALSIALG